MKRVAAAVLCAALVALTACGHARPAEPPIAWQPSASSLAEPRGPLLWRVDGPHGTTYLYGTLHVGGRAFVPDAAWTALAASHTLVLETDVDAIDAHELRQRSTFAAGEDGLDERMGPGSWQQLVAALRGEIAQADLERVRPWFAITLLLGVIRPAGLDRQAVDKAIRLEATKAGAKLEFLEPWQSQISALDESDDVHDLVDMLHDLDKQRREYAELVAAYRDGDVPAIERTSSPLAFGVKGYQLTIKDRNARWLPLVEAYCTAGGAFIAVGAGHLPGPDGLLDGLRARGFTVTRVLR